MPADRRHWLILAAATLLHSSTHDRLIDRLRRDGAGA
jgi:hypothetical protein